MQVEVKVHSVYDEKAVVTFYNMNMYKGKNPKKVFTNRMMLAAGLIVLAVFGILAVDYAFLNVILQICIASIIILVVVNCCLYFWLPKWVYKTEFKHGNAEIDFTFYDDEFEGTSVKGGITGNRKIKYDALSKIIESKKYFLLYDHNSGGYMLSKDVVSSEDAKTLRIKFIEVMPEGKYITIRDW